VYTGGLVEVRRCTKNELFDSLPLLDNKVKDNNRMLLNIRKNPHRINLYQSSPSNYEQALRNAGLTITTLSDTNLSGKRPPVIVIFIYDIQLFAFKGFCFIHFDILFVCFLHSMANEL